MKSNQPIEKIKPVNTKESAAKIAAAHDRFTKSARTALEACAECGALLAEVRDSLPHGQWGSWVEQNCPFGLRQAQKYIAFAERAATLGTSNANPSARLTLNGWVVDGDQDDADEPAEQEWTIPPKLKHLEALPGETRAEYCGRQRNRQGWQAEIDECCDKWLSRRGDYAEDDPPWMIPPDGHALLAVSQDENHCVLVVPLADKKYAGHCVYVHWIGNFADFERDEKRHPWIDHYIHPWKIGRLKESIHVGSYPWSDANIYAVPCAPIPYSQWDSFEACTTWFQCYFAERTPLRIVSMN